MRFTLIDRITALKAGDEITAIKSLSLAEEYLGDHFPLFPVLPGVFMLEAMTQASAWLIRHAEDFAHSVVVGRSAGEFDCESRNGVGPQDDTAYSLGFRAGASR